MKKLLCTLLLAAGVLLNSHAAIASAQYGELMIWFWDEDSDVMDVTDSTVTCIYSDVQSVFDARALTGATALFGPTSVVRNAFQLRFDVAAPIDSIATELRACSEVREVAENATEDVNSSVAVNPNDYAWSHDYWGVGNLATEDGRPDQWMYRTMQVDRGWEITKGSNDLVIAIMDVGLDYQHPDLADHIWLNEAEDINHNGVFDNFPAAQGGDLDGIDNNVPKNGYVDDVIGYDFMFGDPDVQHDDGGRHGSHGTVMGSMAIAKSNNTIGVTGINWYGKLMALKVGTWNYVNSPSAILQALNYAIDNGADIVSMSISWGVDAAHQAAIQRGDALGVLFVVSSGSSCNGNCGPLVNGLSSYPEVVCCSSVYDTGYKDRDAQYGNEVDMCTLSVDVAAQGVVTCAYNYADTIPGIPQYPYSHIPHIYALTKSETSGAAAQISGILGLLKSRYPNASPSFLKSELYRGATPLTDPLYAQGKLGHGLANAFRSLTQWGVITQNATWGGVVYVSGDIRVAQGATLTIQPGTIISVWPDDVNYAVNTGPGGVDPLRAEIYVDGTLNAIGTSEDPIQFRAFDESGSTTDNDAWYGFFVTSGGHATFRHCTIKNARYGIQTNANVTVKNCLIQYCERRGLGVAYSGANNVVVRWTTIRDVGEIGLSLAQGAAVHIAQSTIKNVGINAIDVESNSVAYIDTMTVRDSDTGIFISRGDAQNTVTANIRGCTINHNGDGIYAHGPMSGSIQSCVVDSNTTSGIWVDGSGNAVIKRNTIQRNTNGVFSDHSGPIIKSHNKLQYNVNGIKCDNGSYAAVESCTVNNNTYGVTVVDGSDNLGYTGGGSSSGYNILKPNTTYHIRNFTNYTILAQSNYWPQKPTANPPDCTPKASYLYGSVDASYPLCNQPALTSMAFFPPNDGNQHPHVPAEFGLSEAFPNPFNPSTTVRYSVPNPGAKVMIAIFDVNGKRVRSLVNSHKTPGDYEATWDGRDEKNSPVASGIYFLRMQAGTFARTHKLVLLK